MKNNLQILKAMCHEKPLSSYATMFGYKEEDGKISMKEVDELGEIIKDGSDTLKNITKEDNNDTRGNGEETK